MQEQKQKKVLSLVTLTLVIALAVSLGWGIYENRLIKEYKTKTENQYRRAFNELVTSLNEVETSMAKAKVANSPEQRALFMGETWKGCSDAVSKLAQMPADEVGISYVATIINQIGDFSKEMTRKAAAADIMNPKEQNMFNDMHERVIEVNREVQQISNLVYAENLAWVDKPPGLLQGARQRLGIGQGKTVQTAAQGEEGKGKHEQGGQGDNQQPPESVRGGLKQLDASLQKYPPFSYQGELDKHYVEKPLGLPEGEIAESKAIAAAAEFLHKVGYDGAAPEVSGLAQGPLGGYVLKFKDVFMEVTKKGGVVIQFRDQREISDRQLDEDQVKEKALSTLEKLGWKMVITSTNDYGSYFQIEVVSQINEVRIYPDKIRLMVATDNGQLVGFDASPYYAYHHERNLTPILSMEQAKAKLAKNFKVLENRLVVIAKQGAEEALCYEFRGNMFGEEYLINIHAIKGTEERINRVIITPRGKLLQ